MSIRPSPCVVLGCCLLALAPAVATDHLMVIDEVFVGPPAEGPSNGVDPGLTPDQRAQYIMVRMTAAGQEVVVADFLRIEDQNGNILGKFGTWAANVANAGVVGCVYPNCPAIIMGTLAGDNLFTFNFDQQVNGQASRVAIPASGGRACIRDATTNNIYDCVAWGNFACTPANCPAGPNSLHAGDTNSGVGANLCDTNYGTPAAGPTGLKYGKALKRSTFSCAAKENSTQFSLQFPKPRNNAGTNNDTDGDVDGLINVLDCAPANSTLLWRPVEVQNERVTGQSTSTLSWDPQTEMSGSGVTYDVIRGTLANVNGFTDHTCFANNFGATMLNDSDPLAAGQGFYYLERAGSTPGCVGTYGAASLGSRDPVVAAVVGTCP